VSNIKVTTIGIHVVPYDDLWAVRTAHAYRAWRLFPSKADALKAAPQLWFKGKPRRLYVHDETGRIERRVCLPKARRV
jgi:hypothetical protein